MAKQHNNTGRSKRFATAGTSEGKIVNTGSEAAMQIAVTAVQDKRKAAVAEVTVYHAFKDVMSAWPLPGTDDAKVRQSKDDGGSKVVDWFKVRVYESSTYGQRLDEEIKNLERSQPSGTRDSEAQNELAYRRKLRTDLISLLKRGKRFFDMVQTVKAVGFNIKVEEPSALQKNLYPVTIAAGQDMDSAQMPIQLTVSRFLALKPAKGMRTVAELKGTLPGRQGNSGTGSEDNETIATTGKTMKAGKAKAIAVLQAADNYLSADDYANARHLTKDAEARMIACTSIVGFAHILGLSAETVAMIEAAAEAAVTEGSELADEQQEPATGTDG